MCADLLRDRARRSGLRVVLRLIRVNADRVPLVVADINGLAAAPFLVIVMLVTANRKVMGQFRNGGVATVLDWLTVALMAAAAVTMLATGSRPVSGESDVGTAEPGRLEPLPRREERVR